MPSTGLKTLPFLLLLMPCWKAVSASPMEAMRQVTGGSYTTISPALNEWKVKQAAAAMPLRGCASIGCESFE